jgi:hypothetical protein
VYWNSFCRFEGCSVFDIYPEDETHLTEIAYLDIDSINDLPGYLLPDKVIWFKCLKDRIVFRVWDYRLDHSLIFSVDVDVENLGFDLEVYFILSKALKLASNSFVGRWRRRIPLSSSYVERGY